MPGSILLAGAALIAFRFVVLRTSRNLRSYFDSGPWGDALCYFIQGQYYRKFSGRELDPRCLWRGKSLHTPSFYHRFVLRPFSERMLWKWPWLPNFALYGISIVFFLALAAEALPEHSISLFALLSLAFASQSANSNFDSQNIHYLTIQPRLLGAMAMSANALLFVVMPSITGVLVLGTLFVTVALNTSVFSRQVAYFVLPLASLFCWSVIPVLTLISATLLSLLLNREEFVESMRAQWRYSKWYFNNFYETRKGGGLSYFIRRTFAPPAKYLPRHLDSAFAMAMLGYILLRENDVFVLRAFGMITATAAVCGITALRKFASLGECGRYFTFNCWFVTPLAIAYSVAKVGWPTAPVSFALALLLLANTVRTYRGRLESNPIAEINTMLRSAFLNARQPKVWWSAHYRYGSIPLALGYGESTFELQGTDLSEDVMKKLFLKYPFLHCGPEFFNEFRVTHLLISKSEWPQELYGPLDQVMSAHQVLADSGNYVVLARQG